MQMAADLDAAARVEVGTAMRRQVIAYLETRTWASRAGPGRPLSIGSVGMGACTMVSQARLLIFGRTCSTRLKCESTYSSAMRSSTPIRPNLVSPHLGETHGASCKTISSGRWSSKGARTDGFFVDGGVDAAVSLEAGERVCRAASLSSMSPSRSAVCSISRSSFSDDRPKRARRRIVAKCSKPTHSIHAGQGARSGARDGRQRTHSRLPNGFSSASSAAFAV